MARSYLLTTNGITSKQKEKGKRNPNGKMRKATKENGYHIKRLGKQIILPSFKKKKQQPPLKLITENTKIF